MARVARDVPINVMVQLFFKAGKTPGLRTITRAVRVRHTCGRIEILPTGGRFELPGVGSLRASYDSITDRHPIEVLTLSLTPSAPSRKEREADRLDTQSRLLQDLISELDAEETHWHLLPGGLDRKGEQRLAQRAITLLRQPVRSAGRMGRIAAGMDAPDGGPGSSRGTVGIRPANDLPALPRLRHEGAAAILSALSDCCPNGRENRLSLTFRRGPFLMMSLGARA